MSVPHGLNKKLKRVLMSLKELFVVSSVLGILFEKGFTLQDGQSIKI